MVTPARLAHQAEIPLDHRSFGGRVLAGQTEGLSRPPRVHDAARGEVLELTMLDQHRVDGQRGQQGLAHDCVVLDSVPIIAEGNRSGGAELAQASHLSARPSGGDRRDGQHATFRCFPGPIQNRADNLR